MAIFGMNGLQALALDFLLIFAVYGMKEVALTTNQVATVGRVVARKSMKNDKSENAAIARAAREQVLRSMALKSPDGTPLPQNSKKHSGQRRGSVKTANCVLNCVNHQKKET